MIKNSKILFMLFMFIALQTHIGHAADFYGYKSKIFDAATSGMKKEERKAVRMFLLKIFPRYQLSIKVPPNLIQGLETIIKNRETFRNNKKPIRPKRKPKSLPAKNRNLQRRLATAKRENETFKNVIKKQKAIIDLLEAKAALESEIT